MNEALIESLIELAKKFRENEIELILGGGLGLYLRYVSMVKNGDLKLQYNPRSTNDMDIFFTADIISKRHDIETVKKILSGLNYKVLDTAKYFQFIKKDIRGNEIKIDLLAPPPEDKSKVKIKPPRIKPKNAEEIHARLTPEAKHINIGLKNADLSLLYNLDQKLVIYLVSDYNYIILKLHAFADRINDEKKYFGRYHALDIFTTVTNMQENDWNVAQKHLEITKGCDYIKKCISIIQDYFPSKDKKGIIRLKENENYKTRRTEYDDKIDDFILDLKELFGIE